MKKSTLHILTAGLAVSGLLLLGSNAFAQFNLPKMPKLGGSDAAGAMSADDLGTSLTGVKAQFSVAMKEMITAHSITMAALGKKEEADKLAAEAKFVSEGDCDSSCMKRAIKVSDEAAAMSKAGMDQSGEISTEGKAILATAVAPYMRGTAASVGLPGAFATWVSGAQSSITGIQSNPLQAVSAAKLIREVPEITQVSTSLPGLVSRWGSTSANFSSFARKQGVDTKALDAEAKSKF